MEKELKDKIEKKAEKLASMFAGNGGGVLIAGCVKNEDGSSDSYVCLKGRGLSVAEALGALCKKSTAGQDVLVLGMSVAAVDRIENSKKEGPINDERLTS